MGLKRVRWEPEDEAFRVEGGGSFTFDDGSLVVPLDVAGEVSVAHLTRAIARSREDYGDPEWIVFVGSEPEWEPPAANVSVAVAEFIDERIVVVASVDTDAQHLQPPELARLVGPLLARHRARWRASWANEDRSHLLGWMISAELIGQRRSVQEIADLGSELQTFCSVVSGQGELNVTAVRHLIATGGIRLLLGQPEGSWLDAKRAPYKLSSDAEKWEMAKDVASFANSDRDAIILIGVTTEGTPNGDVLTAARPFHLLEMDVPAIRAVLRDRIVPLIPDLDIGVVEVRDGFGYGWIRIPQQPSELKPFLVAGALVTAGFLGAHVAIPFRAVEDTAYLDAAAIHSFIAAGRASLRRGS